MISNEIANKKLIHGYKISIQTEKFKTSYLAPKMIKEVNRQIICGENGKCNLTIRLRNFLVNHETIIIWIRLGGANIMKVIWVQWILLSLRI